MHGQDAFTLFGRTLSRFPFFCSLFILLVRTIFTYTSRCPQCLLGCVRLTARRGRAQWRRRRRQGRPLFFTDWHCLRHYHTHTPPEGRPHCCVADAHQSGASSVWPPPAAAVARRFCRRLLASPKVSNAVPSPPLNPAQFSRLGSLGQSVSPSRSFCQPNNDERDTTFANRTPHLECGGLLWGRLRGLAAGGAHHGAPGLCVVDILV